MTTARENLLDAFRNARGLGPPLHAVDFVVALDAYLDERVAPLLGATMLAEQGPRCPRWSWDHGWWSCDWCEFRTDSSKVIQEHRCEPSSVPSVETGAPAVGAPLGGYVYGPRFKIAVHPYTAPPYAAHPESSQHKLPDGWWTWVPVVRADVAEREADELRRQGEASFRSMATVAGQRDALARQVERSEREAAELRAKLEAEHTRFVLMQGAAEGGRAKHEEEMRLEVAKRAALVQKASSLAEGNTAAPWSYFEQALNYGLDPAARALLDEVAELREQVAKQTARLSDADRIVTRWLNALREALPVERFPASPMFTSGDEMVTMVHGIVKDIDAALKRVAALEAALGRSANGSPAPRCYEPPVAIQAPSGGGTVAVHLREGAKPQAAARNIDRTLAFCGYPGCQAPAIPGENCLDHYVQAESPKVQRIDCEHPGCRDPAPDNAGGRHYCAAHLAAVYDGTLFARPPKPADTAPKGPHLVDGEFQSDKYPTTPRGKVPLSVKDPTAQDLLWEYAQRRRSVDADFATDLEAALRAKGFTPPPPAVAVPDIPPVPILAALTYDTEALRGKT